jgi:cobalamin biosynthesis protein CobT
MTGDTIATKLMESMGWKDGMGLGKDGQGKVNPLRPTKKNDTIGLGSKQVNGKWLDACCAYDAVLQKLNIAYSSDTKAEESEEDEKTEKQKRKEKKRKLREEQAQAEADSEAEDTPKKKRKSKKVKVEEDEEETKTVTKKEEEKEEDEDSDKPIPVARHLIYAKRLKSKQVEGYSDCHKAEIFASIQRQVRHEQARKDKYERPAGFTEETQVDIYNEVVDKQVKGRIGLGVAHKASKSVRRETATQDHRLMRIGQYLSRKFVHAGTLEEVHRKPISSC